ncbi:MAG TPA: SAM-dependent methyltransferase [Firmicutes bacterium]|jgi:ubiquinone/menaquinone biosynthesis C-methylase UbiE|nr:SAM-dependent methyltransferase [Bacillota bacterium]
MGSTEYFEQVASNWDQMRQSFFDTSVREKAYQIAGLSEGKTAADIGAGTGFITEGLIAKGLKVIAVDRSAAMLEQMKAKFIDSNLIVYRTGQSTALSITDKAVDYTFANMYLHHVEFPILAIQEMTRILKPNGKLIITDLDEHDFDFLVIEQHDRWKGFKRADIKRWLTEAGLKNVTVDCMGENCCADSCCGKEKAEISIFIASGIK